MACRCWGCALGFLAIVFSAGVPAGAESPTTIVSARAARAAGALQATAEPVVANPSAIPLGMGNRSSAS
jgi:hypothetical protein